MNRQRYKLVFNRHRGQLMAVAEIASSIQHHGRTSANAAAMPDLLPSALRFSLLAIALALAMNTVAHAQILGDRNAPRNQQPTVLVTPNGVPVVNIQTPSTAGVSVNSYRQFDVGPNGAILNNAQGTTSTQLGGYVAGNPWLATGAARVIVNQVNSANPSYLRGYLEVAGARAQVVVANPAGITCSGCGFINANRATLTTGVPQVVNGNLESYRVASGAVRIEGNGLDASRTDYAEIIARAVQVNAGVWAPELKLSAGLNTVSADHASVVPGVAAADAAPAVAIDVAQLGGMYAGHIFLTSTEHGVGVRNAGSIGASVGQAVVTADGRLENSGSLTATGLLAVQATGGISNAGELGSKSAASLNTTALDNSGSIASAGTLAVQASGAVRNTGSIGGEGSVQIAAASLDNRNTIGSSTTLAVQAAGTISNSGTLQATGDPQRRPRQRRRPAAVRRCAEPGRGQQHRTQRQFRQHARHRGARSADHRGRLAGQSRQCLFQRRHQSQDRWPGQRCRRDRCQRQAGRGGQQRHQSRRFAAGQTRCGSAGRQWQRGQQRWPDALGWHRQRTGRIPAQRQHARPEPGHGRGHRQRGSGRHQQPSRCDARRRHHAHRRHPHRQQRRPDLRHQQRQPDRRRAGEPCAGHRQQQRHRHCRAADQRAGVFLQGGQRYQPDRCAKDGRTAQ